MTLPPSVQVVVDLVNAAAGDLAPSEGDCDDGRAVWTGGADVDRYDPAAWWMWITRKDERRWTPLRDCGCGCGGCNNSCDACHRAIVRAEDYGNPNTTSSYWLCRECRDEWEERGQYNRDGDCVGDD